MALQNKVGMCMIYIQYVLVRENVAWKQCTVYHVNQVICAWYMYTVYRIPSYEI